MAINTKCQVFTPPQYAKTLLDYIGYKQNLHNRKIAENSCGDGNILVEIVERYIKDCKKNSLNPDQIKQGLENDIYGAELDQRHIDVCIGRLDQIANKHKIYNVNWNIFRGDFLKTNTQCVFDFVVGNPPYITYSDLEKEDRTYLRENYAVCSIGKFDYCYAFIEASIKSLTENGKLAYLIPTNIFKNVFAANLRKLLLPHLTNIFDFSTKKLFENKLTSSAIIIYDKTQNKNHIIYNDIVNNKHWNISKETLLDKWQFHQPISTTKDRFLCFGDYFHTANSVATLLNEVYIINNFTENKTNISVGNYQIEKSLLKVAKSPRSINLQKEEYIIFPYYYENNTLIHYSKDDFETIFPFGTQYLYSFAKQLKKRQSDKGIEWFEYGRSQALSHLNQPKLLLSTLITTKVRVYYLTKQEIPTSGLYIIPKNNISLNIAKKILESDPFLEYVNSIGIVANGKSVRITSKDIERFLFPAEYLR